MLLLGTTQCIAKIGKSNSISMAFSYYHNG